ncbi:peptidoglycan editing factor PgeF [Celerinatantimonas sp. YJH-8]|uniref:peptidoglycan editing factor PgeF n=1 Tax=Celerinatantimonas sp. YJH-8 TaxID=3228714 RepID=UPI0038C20415
MAIYPIEGCFPTSVRAVYTDRLDGASRPPFDAFNLGDHVGDNPQHVIRNRQSFQECLPGTPCWLSQVHGTHVVDAGLASPGIEADAALARGRHVPCVVMTADCLPVLLADNKGRCVAAIHGGWRGLASGIIGKTIVAMHVPAQDLQAWLGPAIGPSFFQVGPEVRSAFVDVLAESESAFQADGDKYLADIKLLAELQLRLLGVKQITRHPGCTYADSEHFFSYRRDGQTGRMAAAIWLE